MKSKELKEERTFLFGKYKQKIMQKSRVKNENE